MKIFCTFLPPANEVWDKVMFLHLSVYRGGGWLPSMHHRSHDLGGLHPGGVCIQERGSVQPPPLPKQYLLYLA